MRILLILLQTIVFLGLLAAILLSLYLLSSRVTEPESAHLSTRVAVFVFGSLPVVAAIFIIVSAVNLWLVFGPLVRVEDPTRRTLQHLGLMFVQIAVLLTVCALALAAILLHFM
jgi:hypothetical protein